MKENNKFKWYIADKDYITYLKNFDNKVENIDYKTKLKPYIGILLHINKFNYYVPVSSPKEKHYLLKESLDFIKITYNDKILSILNLNNMVPIPDDNVNILKYKDIDMYRNFNNEKEKKSYIALLSLELNLINAKLENIQKKAIKLYNEKINHPNSKVSIRCCNFKLLEEKCLVYKKSI